VAAVAWASPNADASIILLTLPATSDAPLQDETTQVWPWIRANLPAGEQQPSPPVKLAPELNGKESAAHDGVGPAPMGLGTIAASFFLDRVTSLDANLVRQQLAGAWDRAIQWRESLINKAAAHPWHRAEQSVVVASESRLEASPPVASAAELPHRNVRGFLTVGELAGMSRRMIAAAELDATRAVNSLKAWRWSSGTTPIAESFEEAEVEQTAETQVSQQPRQTAPVPLSVLARPVVRSAADVLNDAGASLQSWACGLTEWSESTTATSAGRSPQAADNAALADDPAAGSYFED
jgi:hypothetical protein